MLTKDSAPYSAANRDRAHDVALHRLGGVTLQQREVLERGRVEDDLRAEPPEHLTDPMRIADVSQDRLVGAQQSAAVQRELNGVQSVLVTVEHDQLCRAELVQLAAQL